MYTQLKSLSDQLSEISGVLTCGVGVEANLSPADFPMIRIVPTRLTAGRGYRERLAELTVYFGHPLTDADGLECVYEKLAEMEAEILPILQANECTYIDTITDQDLLEQPYKLMQIRCTFPIAV